MFASKVLLATDGSPEAEHAARMAISLSKGLGAELHVAYVGHVTSLYAASETEILAPRFQERLAERAGAEARKKLDAEVEKINAIGAELAGVHVGVGRPDAGIVRIAEDLGAELVVLGSRGFGPLRRALMGSVSNSVVRHYRGSVLVVRGVAGDGHTGDLLPGRVLLALDGSEEANAATRAAVEISNATGSELHVVHVLDTNPRVPYPSPGTWQTWEEELDHAKRQARAWVDRQAERIQAEGGRVKDAHLSFGEPDGEIVKLGEELGAALIVIGSRGLSGMSRMLMGSVSDSVVRHAHGPVLVTRDPGSSGTQDLAGAGAEGEA